MTPRQTEASVTAERAMRDALDGADQLRDGPLDRASVVLSLLSAAGWAVVPVVPTADMLAVGDSDRPGDPFNQYLHSRLPNIWAAMLAAADRR